MGIKKVLVVDDSPTDRYVLTNILEQHGFSVSTAESGDDALQKIREDRPQLVLLDVVMPGKNGYQVTRQIARDPSLKDLPVMMCSVKAQETDRIWALCQGACDYIVKPVDPDELLAKISAIE
ncbi:response regulator transcription factor [Herbaspirillum robiniae]|uniref:Response regulator n=1 Tax=Herbaspirillum robiniae TaxID=2014887 RepID=A0A246WMC5_9BURK|nr:response regulator [Herbaspirillum robiniae]NUU03433.1 response regulator [Herbaspirillum robiniae]OWY27509.1 two-component system response regulator [Herbaspirillum robiniae]